MVFSGKVSNRRVVQFRQRNVNSSDDSILHSLRSIPFDSFWHLELPCFIHTFARRYAEVCLLLHLLCKLHALPFRVVRLSDRTLTVYRRRGRLYLDSKRTYKYTWNSADRERRWESDRKGKRILPARVNSSGPPTRTSFRRQDVRARGWYPLTLPVLKRENFDSIFVPFRATFLYYP